jgi:hypothetical protein
MHATSLKKRNCTRSRRTCGKDLGHSAYILESHLCFTKPKFLFGISYLTLVASATKSTRTPITKWAGLGVTLFFCFLWFPWVTLTPINARTHTLSLWVSFLFLWKKTYFQTYSNSSFISVTRKRPINMGSSVIDVRG